MQAVACNIVVAWDLILLNGTVLKSFTVEMILQWFENGSLGLKTRIKSKIEPFFAEGFDDVRVKLAVYYPPLIRMIVSLSLNSR